MKCDGTPRSSEDGVYDAWQNTMQLIVGADGRKRAAVDREDYDTAKAIKADIDKLRSAAESSNSISGSSTRVTARTLDDVPVGPRTTEVTEYPREALPHGESAAEESPVLDGASLKGRPTCVSRITTRHVIHTCISMNLSELCHSTVRP